MTSKRLTVFASGTGSNFISLHQSVQKGIIPATITAFITDKPGCSARSYAKEHNITDYVLRPADFDSHDGYVKKLLSVLEEETPDLILLAGYLKKIPDEVIRRYPKKILNIHPSLLPLYGGKGWYGHKVHHAVIENGDIESGCTIHYVTEVYDDGPIIAQRKVPVFPEDHPDSLAKRVLKEEHTLYTEVVKRLLEQS
ncbi:phosphoribosylglycinamide formyltransferase [Balneolaceae bacterium ANBcel3]|nr:phosphoribosylglycinamide formyltransferase [Balneolaceae bacterium ANBcel3]